MSIGPLRRLVGALGLVALVPLLAMVTLGTLDPVDAAFRAAVMVAVLHVVGRVAGWGMGMLAVQVETVEATADATHEPSEA